MRVVAVTMVRDERDILPHTLGHLLKQVDQVLVADNGSVDGTREYLDELAAHGAPIKVLDDPEPAYRQDAKMTRLAYMAGDEYGAQWVVPFDADEAWTLDRALIDADVVDVIQTRSHVFVPTDRDDPAERDPLRRIDRCTFTQEPLPKVTFRWHPAARLHMGNHGVDWPSPTGVRAATAGDMRHFQYRSLEQLTRKVRQGTKALEAATEISEGTGFHWRQLARLDDDALADWWRAYTAQPLMRKPWIPYEALVGNR